MHLSTKVKFIIATIAFALPIVVATTWNVIFNVANPEATVKVSNMSATDEGSGNKKYTISVSFNKKAKDNGQIDFTYVNDRGNQSFYLEYKDGKTSCSTPYFTGLTLKGNPRDVTLVTTKIPAYWSTGTLFISLVSIIPAPAFVIDTVKLIKESKEKKKALQHQKEDAAKINN